MTNPAFNEKTAARRLSEMTGHSYQKCLTALRSQDLGSLIPNPAGVYPVDVIETAAAGLAMSGAYPTPHEAKAALLTATLTASVRSCHPTATSEAIWMDDNEYPAVGVLSGPVYEPHAQVRVAPCRRASDAVPD